MSAAKTSLIRWERVGPVGGVVGSLLLAIVLLLDPFLKWVLVKSGQEVFGARVDVASVKTTLLKSRLTLRGLQVADKSAPMKNLFQWEEAVFDFRSAPLFEKKVVIDEASLSGLQFGTPRKTSGELTGAEKQPGAVSQAAGKLWEQVETISLEKFEDAKKAYDPKTLMGSLESLKVADQAKERIQKAPETLDKQVHQVNAEARVKDLQTRVEALSKGGSGTEDILKRVNEAKALQSELEALRADLTAAQRTVSSEIQAAQGLVDEVRKAKEADWKTLRSKLSLPALDSASIARALFGPTVATWGERLLDGIDTVRRQMPNKPKSPPPPPRGKARIIEFPRTNVLPRFLLVKALVSGEVGQDRPFGFTGTLTGITTNPPLYGKPATLVLQGTQGPRSFELKGVLDHTRDVPLDTLQGSYAGFSLNNLGFGQKDNLALDIQKGEGQARAVLTAQGDRLMGHAEMRGSNLTIDPHIDLKSNAPIAQRAAQSITSSLRGVQSIDLGVKVSGTLSAPAFDIESNLGSIVANALKNALGAEAAEQEKVLRAELEKRTAGPIKDLEGSVSGLQQKYLSQFTSTNKLIDDLLAQLKSQGTRSLGAGGALKNLFGK